MNKRFFVLLSCVTILFFSTACITVNFGNSNTRLRGSGDVVTQSRVVSDFERVSLAGIGDLELTLGDQESLEIEAEDNIIEQIETEVRNGTLYISIKEHININPTQTIRYRLTMQKLTGLEISGVGNADVGEVETDSLDVHVSGVGSVEIESLQADKLSVELSGAGNCKVKAGQVQSQKINLSGAGSYDAPDLQSETTYVNTSGAGNAKIWATETLDISLSGVGSVRYYGDPHISQNVSGVGSVKSLGER